MSDCSAADERSVPQNQQQQTVEVVLEPEVYGALCRRGRRRLRDIQSACQAALKLDRFRGVLQVTGSQKSISDVFRQLESLSGPCLRVTAAVWAELMRTRKLTDLDQAAVAKMQHESGCRIHIDRNAQDVRLFGRQDKILVAQRLLEELETMCIEQVVQMKCPFNLDAQMLQAFAQDFGVALQVEPTHIAISGIAGAVVEAVNELGKHDPNEPRLEVGRYSEVAHLAISEAMAKLRGNGDTNFDPGGVNYVPAMEKAMEKAMQGTVNAKMPASRAQFTPQQQISSAIVQDTSGQWSVGSDDTCPTCGDASKFCVHCGKPTRKMEQGPLPGCTTCGALNFCVYCGHPTEKTNQMGNTGAPQLPYCEGAGYVYDPDMFSSDRMPMMPVQFVTSPGSPVAVPAVQMQMPCGQGFPIMANTFSNCFPMGSMVTNQANGMQGYMVPVAFGSFD